MAKFEEVYEDTMTLFKRAIEDSQIPGFLRIKVLSNEGLKDCPGAGHSDLLGESLRGRNSMKVMVMVLVLLATSSVGR